MYEARVIILTTLLTENVTKWVYVFFLSLYLLSRNPLSKLILNYKWNTFKTYLSWNTPREKEMVSKGQKWFLMPAGCPLLSCSPVNWCNWYLALSNGGYKVTRWIPKTTIFSSVCSTNTQSSNTQSANTQPTNTEPTNTEPTNTQSTNTQSTNTQPTNTQPTNTQSANTQPTNTQPTNTEPTNTQSTNTQPANTQPTNTQSTNTQSDCRRKDTTAQQLNMLSPLCDKLRFTGVVTASSLFQFRCVKVFWNFLHLRDSLWQSMPLIHLSIPLTQGLNSTRR